MEQPPVRERPPFMQGGGELGGLIRAYDWESSSIGGPEAWPQPLKTAVRLLLSTGHPMFLWWGPDLVQFYNDAYRASIGPERHPSAIGQRGRDCWEEIWPIIGPQIDQVMSGGGATWHVNALVPITRNGRLEEAYWTYSYSPIDDPSTGHGVGGVLVVCTETTEQVLAERRQAETADRQRRLFDQAPGFVIIMRGPDHVVEFVNEAHRRGFGSETWVGRPIRDILPELEGQGLFELLDGVYATGQAHQALGAEVRHRFPPNNEVQTRRLDFVYAPISNAAGNVEGVFCTGTDVTDSRRAQIELAESEARFRNMAEHAPVMMWITDAAGRCTYLNRRWYEFTGQSHGEAEGHGWLDATHPDDKEATEAAFASANAAQIPFRIEYRLRRADGRYRWAIDAASPRFDAGQKFLGYVGSVIDIDDRREAEQALAVSEERLRLATENAEVGFWDVDLIADALIWPPRVKAMFGISADVPVTMADFYAGLHPEDHELTATSFAAALDPVLRAVYDVEYRTVGKEDGVLRWVAAKGRGLFNERGECIRVIGTAIDITPRKRAEEHLRLMVNELNHRVKNSLATVQAIAAQTLRRDEIAPEVREVLTARLVALAKAHDVLTDAKWSGADLLELVQQAAEPYTAEGQPVRFLADGPNVNLPPRAAIALSLALHELTTNAVKYGALSSPAGRVRITWAAEDVDGGRRLKLIWSEEGGPPVAAPKRTGFGARLIQRSLAAELGGTAQIDFRRDGVICTIEANITPEAL